MSSLVDRAVRLAVTPLIRFMDWHYTRWLKKSGLWGDD